MNLPSWLSLGRKDKIVQAIVMSSVGTPKWTDRDFAPLMREGYQWNVTLAACVNYISECVAGVNWKLYSNKTKKKEIEDHSLLDLLSRPNKYQVWDDFIITKCSFDLLVGNSFIYATAKDLDPLEKEMRGLPGRLEVLRPDRVKIVPAENELVGHFEYTVNGIPIKLHPSRVLHQKTFNPLNDFYGFGKVEGAAASVDTDNAALRWNASLLMNDARPSGILIVKGNLTDEQYQKLQAQVQEKYSGPANAGRPMILQSTDGSDWKQTSLSPIDMDWSNGKKITGLEICRGFKMPPELVGFTDATFNNRKEAKKSVYEETVLPYMDRVRSWLNVWLTPMFGDKLYLDYDKDDIEALQEDRTAIHTRSLAAYTAGAITNNEFREETGRDPSDDEFADERLIPFSVVPVTDLQAQTDVSTAPDEEQKEEPENVPGDEDGKKKV